METKKRGIRVVLVTVLVLLGISVLLEMGKSSPRDYTRAQFKQDIKDDLISEVEIIPNTQTPSGRLEIAFRDGSSKVLYVADVEEMEDLLEANDILVMRDNIPQDTWFKSIAMPILIAVVCLVLFMMLLNASAGAGGGGGSKMMNFGKSRARVTMGDNNSITLKDVAGLKEEKEELEEIISFLRNPAQYTKVGARIPKGVLLEGPPGTGKTLLAKAIAGEANVPFFSISGSDFVEMFVGVGASRVRDLFEDAKKNHPCIVFIDEIDAVARKRGTGMGGGHDEREQTLNQLLVEMDGFEENTGIIVLAATNRVDILDPAILRPGRFDRKIVIGPPDVGGREEILHVHAKNKPFLDDVNLKHIAQKTAGFTGADLENLLNESAINAAKDNRDVKPCLYQRGRYQPGIYQNRNRYRKTQPYYFRRRKKDHRISRIRTCDLIPCSSGCRAGLYGFHHPDRTGSGRLYHATAGKR